MIDDPTLPVPLVSPEVDLRTQAATQGKCRYFDGKPCVHGHTADRYTRNASCVECQRLRCKADKERIRALMSRGSR